MTERFLTDAGHVLLKREDEEPQRIKGGLTDEGFTVIHSFYRGWLPFGYLRDNKGVWWFDGRKMKASLVSRDAEAFRVLDDDYGVGREYVYLEDKVIPGADPATFTLLTGSPYYAVDKHRLYVKNGDRFHTWEDIDVKTAAAHMDYCVDKDHVLHLFQSLSYANGSKNELVSWLRDTHPDEPGWWNPGYDKPDSGAERIQGSWYRTDKAVFYAEEDRQSVRNKRDCILNLAREADPESFEALSDVYGRDKKGVYCTWRKVCGADPLTMHSLGGLFAKDAKAVYYNGYPVPAADAATFSCLLPSGHLGLSKDKNHVYHAQFARTSRLFGHPDYILEPLPDADPESFEILSGNGSWAIDRDRVYQWGSPAKKMDRESFVFLFEQGPESWAYDRNGLYNANGKRTVKGIDGGSFAMLNRYWGKDDSAVFSFVTGGVQRTADAATFRVIDDNGGAEDKEFLYQLKEDGTIRKVKRK